jgi:hypothetical protein
VNPEQFDIILFSEDELNSDNLAVKISSLDGQQNTFSGNYIFQCDNDPTCLHLNFSEYMSQYGDGIYNISIEEINNSSIESICKIEEIDEKTAKELIERSGEFLKKDAEEISNKISDLGVKEDLVNLKGLTPGMLVTLGEQKILTLKDFAELASDELTGAYDIFKGERIKIKGYLEDFALSKKEADELIMGARDIVYKD